MRADGEVPLPVARVCVMVSPIHLDRPFDYLVPDRLADEALPGCRVRLRFAGRLVDGFVLSREPRSDHQGRLLPIERVSGPVVVTPAVLTLARSVADRYCGTLAEILRTAIPPRHARTERAVLDQSPRSGPDRLTGSEPVEPESVDPACAAGLPGESYPGSRALLRRLARAELPTRAALTLAVGDDPVRAMVDLLSAGICQGSGLVIAPDGRMVAEIVAGIRRRLPEAEVEQLTADLGPSPRYRAFLRIALGSTKVVVGTRSAVFAPLGKIGVAILWDDGDDNLAEPHHPGWHAREVLAMRSRQEGFPLVIGGYARTPEVTRMVANGFLQEIRPGRDHARRSGPLVSAVERGDDPDSRHRIPGRAFRLVRSGLESGPVLIQVARAGYLPAVACVDCRTRARCPDCGGPLRLDSSDRIGCGWCSGSGSAYRCPGCNGTRLRSLVVGASRTAEEIGRAFPGVRVIESGAATGVRAEVSGEPAIVVATVGAEPRADGGYSAAVVLDGDLMLGRADHRAEEEALRRWLRVASLVRDRSAGGVLLIGADARSRAVQAVLRADPVGWAERELAERVQARVPPAVAVATIDGEADSAAGVAREVGRTLGVDPIGPRETGSGPGGAPRRPVGYLLIVEKRVAGQLAAELKSVLVRRSAAGGPIPMVRIDPPDLG